MRYLKDNNYAGEEEHWPLVQDMRGQMFESLDKLLVINNDMAKVSDDKNTQLYNTSSKIIYSFIIGALLISTLLGVILSIYMTRSLKKGLDFAKAIGNGDLSKEIDLNSKDEFGQLATALNNAQGNIKEMVLEIMKGSEELSASSEELSATVEEITSKLEIVNENTGEIAKETQESSAMTEEINATMEEVAKVVQHIASSAQNTSSRSMDILSSIGETTQAMEQVSITAENQATIAGKLNTLVQKFNL
ncbi:methyl-accepting chemotaxis protein [Clostridium sp. CS001]|uniref:methyl-accepting chemotaxis protein n=1 Tax=Clostridium sp. CS001 TaxID=2880648 RepID=UPI001CF224C6|nr:methyl-accepting chemotaxis protein [Clostridium sp. CS001]MCB2289398.1 methyl-accepting chemotaxis protein [Clostridium sp. CS001]